MESEPEPGILVERAGFGHGKKGGEAERNDQQQSGSP